MPDTLLGLTAAPPKPWRASFRKEQVETEPLEARVTELRVGQRADSGIKFVAGRSLFRPRPMMLGEVREVPKEDFAVSLLFFLGVGGRNLWWFHATGAYCWSLLKRL